MIKRICRNHKVNVYIIECKEFRAKAKFDVVEFHGGEK